MSVSSVSGSASRWVTITPSLFQNIASGVTGDIATITAPAGQLVRIHHLTGSGGTQAGISLEVDGTDIITELILAANTPASVTTADTFFLAEVYGHTDVNSGAMKVASQIGSEIKIKKNAGNTAIFINYAYEFGVLL